jgi:hypothetical protein
VLAPTQPLCRLTSLLSITADCTPTAVLVR